MTDIPIADAMLCWNSGFNGSTPAFKVVRHPDRMGASTGYRSSVGACFSDWRSRDAQAQKLQLLIEAWHIVAFNSVPVEMVRDGLLAIPEYREMLADDCLPKQFQHERD